MVSWARIFRIAALATLGLSVGALSIIGNVDPWWLGALWFFTIVTVTIGEIIEW